MNATNQESTTSDILTHYGVKGMKWGVRKSKGTTDPKKLSDEELKNRVARLELERRYSKLSAEDSGSKVAKIGKSFVGNVIQQSFTNTAAKYATQGLEYGLKKGLSLVRNAT